MSHRPPSFVQCRAHGMKSSIRIGESQHYSTHHRDRTRHNRRIQHTQAVYALPLQRQLSSTIGFLSVNLVAKNLPSEEETHGHGKRRRLQGQPHVDANGTSCQLGPHNLRSVTTNLRPEHTSTTPTGFGIDQFCHLRERYRQGDYDHAEEIELHYEDRGL